MEVETKVKEHPILFSGPMVKAILDGRKTQTRRVVKPMPFIDYPTGFRLQQEYKLEHHPKCSFLQAGMLCDCQAIYEPWKTERIASCPYGQPGDRLWVRETYADIAETFPGNLHYRADATTADEEWLAGNGWKWRPSIFMPRKYSRIILEITNVRVEQLNNMSYSDCIAEGILDTGRLNHEPGIRPIEQFKALWDSLNGKKSGYNWASNPWTWAISFKRIEA